MKRYKQIIFAILTGIAVLATSCFNDLIDTGSVIRPSEGMGWVQIRVAGAQERTLLPNLSGLQYRLLILRSGETSTIVISETLGDDLSWSGDIPQGTYTVSVIGYETVGFYAVSGYAEMDVLAGETTDITVELNFVQNAEGTLAYEVNMPETVQFLKGEITVVPFSNGIDHEFITLTGENLAGSVNVASGYYLVSLYITGETVGGDRVFHKKTVAAHIIDDLTILAVYTLTEDDFYASGYYFVTNASEFTAAFSEINEDSGSKFDICVDGSFSVTPITLSGTDFGGKTITLFANNSANAAISLNQTGSIFTVGAGVSLEIENITLSLSYHENSHPLVKVNENGKLVLNSGGKITGNIYLSSSVENGGAGVYVDGGTLEIHGGEISGNTLRVGDMLDRIGGGGIRAVNGSTVLMTSGTIKGNRVENNSNTALGGGIYLASSTFVMSGGLINGNGLFNYAVNSFSDPNTISGAYGGGVYIDSSGSFEKTGGIIYGGDVEFNDSDGIPLKNTAGSSENGPDGGHAVFVFRESENEYQHLWRNYTAWEVVNLDSGVTGQAGGWETQSYDVIFNSSGGSDIVFQTVGYGRAAVRPEDPVRTGYTFDDWYGDSDMSVLYNFSSLISGNVTLYAKWNINQYTVTFNSNEGSAVDSQTINYGGTVSRPADPARAGYTFDDWYGNSGLTIVYNFAAPVTGGITLYAKWNINQYTVSFNSSNGSEVASQTVNYGGTASRPANPARTGYTFDDWYTNSALTTAYDFTASVGGNIILYAKWTPNLYTVTFNSNDGSSVASQTVGHGGTVSRPADPAKTGFLFDGWYSNSGLTTLYYFSTPVTSSITLYAKWAPWSSETTTISLGMNEWELVEQTEQVYANINRTFAVEGAGYESYQWYLDGVQVGTDSTYVFNKKPGVYELAVLVTNSAGESRSGSCRVTAVPGPVTSIMISLGMNEWELINQTEQVSAGVNYVFRIEGGSYAQYRWYLDGALAGTASTYTFNRTAGTYEMAVIVINSAGESRSGSCRVTVR